MQDVFKKNEDIKVPLNYIDFFKNGEFSFYVEKEVFYFDPLKRRYFSTSIGLFFIPKIEDSGSVLLEDLYHAPQQLIDNKIVPFACDAGGYLFCFDYRSNHENPKVVLYISDNPEGYDIVDLAPSFEEFINNLKSEDEVDL